MATQTLTLGDVIDASETEQTFTFDEPSVTSSGHRGCLMNDGPNTAYIRWLDAAVTANTNAGSNKGYVKKDEALRIPQKCGTLRIACASAETAKLRFIAD